MKKRLMSAVLALAMVLTLLPAAMLTASAAEPAVQNPSTSVSVSRQAGNDPSTGKQNGNWYWSENVSGVGTVWHKVSGGVISGTGASGTWYSWNDDPNTGIVSVVTNTNGTTRTMKTTSFTLLQDVSIDGLSLTANPTTLTVDVNNNSLILPSNINTMTNLTITNQYGSAFSGHVSDIVKTTKYSATGTDAQKAVKSLTVSITNATVEGINLQNGLSNSVSLLGGADVNGSVIMDSTNSSVVNGNTVWSYTGAQTLRLEGNSSVTAQVNITGTGSTLNVANSLIGGAVTFNSTGGTVAVSGQSSVGMMTIKTIAAMGTTEVAAAYPTINITGGTVLGIDTSTDSKTTSSPTVNVTGATIGSSGIKVRTGTVNINAGSNVTGTITVPSGTLNITGGVSGTTVGNIDLTGSISRTLKVTNSNVTTGDITANNGSTLTVSIPNDLTNKFGTLNLANYTGGGILGGNFKTAASDSTTAAYFTSTLRFRANGARFSGYWAYYGEKDLASAINDLGARAGTRGNIVLVGHTDGSTITLQNGTSTTYRQAIISYSKLASFYLPAVLLGDTITTWTNSIDNVPYDPSGLYTTPANLGNVTLMGQDTGIQLVPTKLNDIYVKGSGDAAVYTGNIRATLNGNVITLTGAVDVDSGYTAIPLVLETDVMDSSNQYQKENVTVIYDSNKKTVIFDMGSYATLAAKSILLTETTLSMNNGKNVYTLNGSGLGVPAPSLQTYTGSTEIQVTVNKSGWTQYQKDALIANMSGDNGVFTWKTIPAMLQAVNAAQLSLNNETTLKNWITTAQNAVWRYGNTTGVTGFNGKGDGSLPPHTTSAPTDQQRLAAAALTSKYAQVWLVPYLQVTVTDINEATGYMTLTMTPYYRVDVSAAGSYDPAEYYTVQTGRTLGAITGDFAGGVTVEFKGLSSAFDTAWMHQDSTYAYQASSGVWTITHGSSTGLGSMVVNATAPFIELKNNDGASASPALWYDSLQAAVDETTYKAPGKEDVIDINAGYTGTGAITVTGEARVFNIKVYGNTTITATASGDLVKVSNSGHDYTVQLLKNIATASGDVTIVMNTAANGYASPNVNTAKAGATVTITAVPNSGYVVSSITAVANTGAAVPISGTTTANRYTLVVPENVTKITITPVFAASNNRTTVTVGTATGGSAVTSAVATGNQAAQGSTVTVTTIPNNNYRTMGLTARTNTGATVTATRTGTNTFSVVLPAGATTVTVTPSFDINNGTPFTDVLSTYWASNEISWAYKTGYVTGTGTYTFSPATYITRGEVLAMLWKNAGSPIVNYTNPFKDVTTSYWAYNAVMWAASKGYIDTNTASYNPMGYASRAEIVEILYRRAGRPPVTGTSGFADVASNAAYANAVTWARQQKLTNGYSGNTYFRPSYAASRAEVATFLYRAFA